MARRILHVDMDAFFASVEAVRDPSVRGKPLIVGGNPDDPRSVVSSASYEARRFGVRSAMPMAQAKKLCPRGVFMRCTHGVYGEVSKRIQAILETTTPMIQMASIDEANLDITGSIHLFGSEDALAEQLKRLVREQEGLTCTIGVAANKTVAKVAANECKPDGYLSIPPGGEADFFAPLPVGKLPGVGPRTQEALESMGIMTVGQLAQMPEAMLKRVVGEQAAIALRGAALGIGSDEVLPPGLPKSISRETTFGRDRSDWRMIEPVLFRLAEHCAHTLRADGLETRRVTLKTRYSDFDTRTFSQQLPEPTSLDIEINDALHQLIPKAQKRRARVRLVGVNLSALSFNQHQMRLFEREQREKWERVTRAMDTVRDKLGFDALHVGQTLAPKEKDKGR